MDGKSSIVNKKNVAKPQVKPKSKVPSVSGETQDNGPGIKSVEAKSSSETSAPSNTPQSKHEIIQAAMEDFTERIGVLEELNEDEMSGFLLEYQDLQAKDESDYHPRLCKTGTTAGNAEKNRYIDILPYDKSRVKLNAPRDYINASILKDIGPGCPVFIASQGPLPSTQRDFWYMVQESGCCCIAMVTNVVEHDTVKCEQYWPFFGSTLAFQPTAKDPTSLEVTMEDEIVGNSWTRRIFNLVFKDADKNVSTTKVTQYQFTSWPDHGVPQDSQALIGFLRAVLATQSEVKSSVHPNGLPLVVHCSAGIGRTGTFIALYAVLCSLPSLDARRPKLDVYNIVRRMRAARSGMVSSEKQYHFLYTAALFAVDDYNRGTVHSKNPVKVPKRGGSRRGSKAALLTVAPKPTRSAPLPPGVRVPVYDEFLALLSEPSLSVVRILSSIAPRLELDDLTQRLFKLFGTQGALLPFVSRVVEWEVHECESEKLLFRRNSLATKLITACLKAYGQPYLKALLVPLIDAMVAHPHSYEVNPAQLDATANITQNRVRLRALAERFLAAIISSQGRFPAAVSLILSSVFTATNKKYPGSGFNAVGCVLFMRFICPSIIVPRENAIYDRAIPPPVARGLVLVSKIMQAVANLTKSGGSFKETFMQFLNSFVRLATPRCEAFLLRVSAVPKTIDEVVLQHFEAYGLPLKAMVGPAKDKSIVGKRGDGSMGGIFETDDITALHRILQSNLAKLQEGLSKSSHGDQSKAVAAIMRKLGPADKPLVKPPRRWVPVSQQKKLQDDDATSVNSLLCDPDEFASEIYPGSNVCRREVSRKQWSESALDYEPVMYEAPLLSTRPKWADPDARKCATPLAFNAFDRAHKVDRRSHQGDYAVVLGLPQNPQGRTGIAGRGCLGRWGVNHVQETVLTRWRRDKTGEVMRRGDAPVLEFAAVVEPTGVSLPTSWLSQKTAHPQIPKILKEALVAGADSSTDATLETLFAQCKIVSQGYVEDSRNTDNAWLESTVCVCHDENNLLADFDLRSSRSKNLQWLAVEDGIEKAPARLLTVLQNTATELKAFFFDKVPLCLRRIFAAIEHRGLLLEGVYRISGNQARVEQLKSELLTQPSNDLSAYDVHELTGVAKALLRSMEPPLLTYELYGALTQAIATSDEEARIAACAGIARRLPRANFRLLEMVLKHLRKIMSEEPSNKMGNSSMASIFGSVLLRSPQGIRGDLADSGKHIIIVRCLLSISGTQWHRAASIREPPASYAGSKLRDTPSQGDDEASPTLHAPLVRIESIDSEDGTARRSDNQFERGSLGSLKQFRGIKSPGDNRNSLTLSETEAENAETDTDGEVGPRGSSASRIQLGDALQEEETDTDMSIGALEPTRFTLSKTKTGRIAFVNESLGMDLDTDDDYQEDDAIAQAIRTDTPPPRSTPVMEAIPEDDNYLVVSHIVGMDGESLNSDFSMDGGAAFDGPDYGAGGETFELGGDAYDDDVEIDPMKFVRSATPPKNKARRESTTFASDDFTQQSWYVAEASRDQLRGLREKPVGTFLVHNSKMQTGAHCISVWNGECIWTGLISNNGGTNYNMEDTQETFATMTELIAYFGSNKCPGDCTLLSNAASVSGPAAKGAKPENTPAPASAPAASIGRKDSVKKAPPPVAKKPSLTAIAAPTQPPTGSKPGDDKTKATATAATAAAKETSKPTATSTGGLAKKAGSSGSAPAAPAAPAPAPTAATGDATGAEPVYDEFGGYYDEAGLYHDADGGYYDENGYYYDAYGGYYDENGYYYDANGGYYDENGQYYDANGTACDPPATAAGAGGEAYAEDAEEEGDGEDGHGGVKVGSCEEGGFDGFDGTYRSESPTLKSATLKKKNSVKGKEGKKKVTIVDAKSGAGTTKGEKPVKEGFLMMPVICPRHLISLVGLGRKKRRWVEVLPGLLKFYKDECKMKPVNVELKADTPMALAKGGKGTFVVTANKEKLEFLCASDDEAKEWLDVLNRHRQC